MSLIWVTCSKIALFLKNVSLEVCCEMWSKTYHRYKRCELVGRCWSHIYINKYINSQFKYKILTNSHNNNKLVPLNTHNMPNLYVCIAFSYIIFISHHLHRSLTLQSSNNLQSASLHLFAKIMFIYSRIPREHRP